MAAVIFGVLGILCCLYCIGIFLSGAFGSWFFLIWGAAGIAGLGVSGMLVSGLWSRIPAAVRGTAAALFFCGAVVLSSDRREDREPLLCKGGTGACVSGGAGRADEGGRAE